MTTDYLAKKDIKEVLSQFQIWLRDNKDLDLSEPKPSRVSIIAKLYNEKIH